MKIQNGKITSTLLGIEDHGILTAYLTIEGSWGGSAFGGYSFDTPVGRANTFEGRRGTAYGCEFIRRVLETLDVGSWENLKGQYVRVECADDHSAPYLRAIGHITKEQWFNPKDDKRLAATVPKKEEK